MHDGCIVTSYRYHVYYIFFNCFPFHLPLWTGLGQSHFSSFEATVFLSWSETSSLATQNISLILRTFSRNTARAPKSWKQLLPDCRLTMARAFLEHSESGGDSNSPLHSLSSAPIQFFISFALQLPVFGRVLSCGGPSPFPYQLQGRPLKATTFATSITASRRCTRSGRRRGRGGGASNSAWAIPTVIPQFIVIMTTFRWKGKPRIFRFCGSNGCMCKYASFHVNGSEKNSLPKQENGMWFSKNISSTSPNQFRCERIGVFGKKNVDLDAGSEPCRSPEPQCPSTQRRSLTISKLFVQTTLRPRLDRPPQEPTATQRPLMSQLFRPELENLSACCQR